MFGSAGYKRFQFFPSVKIEEPCIPKQRPHPTSCIHTMSSIATDIPTEEFTPEFVRNCMKKALEDRDNERLKNWKELHIPNIKKHILNAAKNINSSVIVDIPDYITKEMVCAAFPAFTITVGINLGGDYCAEFKW
jgi:hypothetical protein